MAEFFTTAFLALALGGLIGLERERSGQKLLGVRTFAAVSLMGAISGFLADARWFVVLGFAGVLALCALLYRAKIKTRRHHGMTTVLMLPLTYLFGVLVAAGFFLEAGVAAIAVTFLLVEKHSVHHVATTVSRDEIIDLLIFAIIAFIAYPFIPAKAVDVFGVPLDLAYTWAIVVVVTAISFLIHVLVKYTKHKGAEFAAFLGGMVASVPTITLFSRKIRDPRRLLAVNELVSAGTVTGDLVMLTVIAAGLLPAVAPAMLLMAAAFLATYKKFTPGLENQDVPLSKKPLSLAFIAKFTLVFSAITLLINAIPKTPETLYASAALAGLVSSTSVVAGVAYLFLQGQIGVNVSATAVVIAVIASTFLKTTLTAARYPHDVELWAPAVTAVAAGATGLVLIGAL